MLFAIPCELEANWVFRITESADKRPYWRAVRKAMLVLGTGPLAAVTAVGYALMWGITPAVMHTIFWLALAVWLAEVLIAGFAKVPFTCSYIPGKANVKLFWPLYLLALSAYAYGTARLELWLLAEPTRWVTACSALLLGLAFLRFYGHVLVRRSASFIYEETRDEALQEIGLTPHLSGGSRAGR